MNNGLKAGLEVIVVCAALYVGYRGVRYVINHAGMYNTSKQIEEVSHGLQYDPDVKSKDRITEAQAANNERVLTEMHKLMEKNKQYGINVKPLPDSVRNKRPAGYVDD